MYFQKDEPRERLWWIVTYGRKMKDQIGVTENGVTFTDGGSREWKNRTLDCK